MLLVEVLVVVAPLAVGALFLVAVTLLVVVSAVVNVMLDPEAQEERVMTMFVDLTTIGREALLQPMGTMLTIAKTLLSTTILTLLILQTNEWRTCAEW